MERPASLYSFVLDHSPFLEIHKIEDILTLASQFPGSTIDE